jgi:hypothetical protein
MTPSKSRWLAAAQLGLVSSTFSTLLSQVTASQLGRDALVDWMTVAAIPARDGIISSDPTVGAIAIGIAFHQWADFSWALVFFGLLGRWTERLSPVALAALAVPWALLTSVSEWFILVPLFPFRQPIFTLQQPYWIGFLVHLSSAATYPLFAWFRWRISQAPPINAVRFARRWALGAACVLVVSSTLGAAQSISVSLPFAGSSPDDDRRYVRHMVSHHDQGIELARMGVSRAKASHLRTLAALMLRKRARTPSSGCGGTVGSPNRCRSVRARNCRRCQAI